MSDANTQTLRNIERLLQQILSELQDIAVWVATKD